MDYLLLQYAHIIAFVYWLGGDLGTFVASSYVVKRDLGTEARSTALKIMLACDQGPKLAMPLIFALGLQMASLSGLIQLPGAVIIGMWMITLYWTGNVLVLYFNEGKPFTQKLAVIDLYFRIAVVAGLLAFAGNGLTSDSSPIGADWLAYKILIFAAMVTCGIFIRIKLKPFIPAFVTMMQEGASEETDDIMANSLQKARVFVWGIWAGLFINAAIGLHIIG